MSPKLSGALPLAMVLVSFSSGIGWLFPLVNSRVYFFQHIAWEFIFHVLHLILEENICFYTSIERSCHVESEYLCGLRVVGMCWTLDEKVKVWGGWVVTLIVAITEGWDCGDRLPKSSEYEEKRFMLVEDILRVKIMPRKRSWWVCDLDIAL